MYTILVIVKNPLLNCRFEQFNVQDICTAQFLLSSAIRIRTLFLFSLPLLASLIYLCYTSFQTQSNKGIVDPMLSIWGQQLIVNEDTDQ